MNRLFILFFVLATSFIINSCAAQTNINKSMTNVKKSIVKIETWARLGACDEEAMSCGGLTLISSGTGAVILYGGKKAVLTAAHVCKDDRLRQMVAAAAGEVVLKAIDRNNKQYRIEIMKANDQYDICVLKPAGRLLEPPHIRLSKKMPEYGEEVYNLAAPSGIIDGEMVPIFRGNYHGISNGVAFYSVPAIGGSSGSPILNVKGELIGVLHSVHYKFHHITLATSYPVTWNFIKLP